MYMLWQHACPCWLVFEVLGQQTIYKLTATHVLLLHGPAVMQQRLGR
jgi:hypothetical protein